MVLMNAQRLLRKAQERALTGEEMERVIDWLYGAKNWTAIQFAVAQPRTKQALFVSLLKGCGIDVRRIKTNTELFVAAASRRLTWGEMDELLRTVYGEQSWVYHHWGERSYPSDLVAKECFFVGQMLAKGIEIPPEIVVTILNQ